MSDIPIKEIKHVRRYKAGYEVRTMLIDGKEAGGCPDFEMKSAYTPDGMYIGDPKWAYRLIVRRGIKPEVAEKSHTCCSFGFCEREQKWYGWSHRSIYGFGIGSEVKPGDIAFVPSNREEFLEEARRWYDDDLHKNVKIEAREGGVNIYYEIHPRSRGRRVFTPNGEVLKHDMIEPWPEKWGRGAWKAETLEDARQMAIDFANGVS